MSVHQVLDDYIGRYGMSVSLTAADQSVYHFKAFLQPFKHQNKYFFERGISEIGRVNMSYLNYFGPVSGGGERVKDGAVLQSGDELYLVKKSEVYHLADLPVYIWAVLQPIVKEEASC